MILCGHDRAVEKDDARFLILAYRPLPSVILWKSDHLHDDGKDLACPADDLMTGTTESGRCFTARSRVACKGLGKGYNRQDQRCDDKQARCANPIPHLLVPTVTFSVRLHMTHSKVRVSPADPDVTSESVIGPWHFGHGGRSSTVKSERERAFCDMVLPL